MCLLVALLAVTNTVQINQMVWRRKVCSRPYGSSVHCPLEDTHGDISDLSHDSWWENMKPREGKHETHKSTSMSRHD